MNIVYFCNYINTSGGLDRIVIAKANHLSKKYNITIVTTDQPQKEYFYPLDENVDHIDFSDYDSEVKLWKWRSIYKKIVTGLRPDIVISPTNKESFVLPFFENKAKIIKEMHFSRNFRIIHYSNKNIFIRLSIKLIALFERRIYMRYDVVTPLTFADEKDWNLPNTQVIYNFKPFISKEGAKLKTKTVIAVGRLESEKGYDMLLDAWKMVSVSHPEWRLKICGEGLLKNDLLAQCKENNIENSVIFTGNVKDIKVEYLGASIFVLSSRFEGMPLNLIEAMECGLPIIAFDCPHGPREMVKDDKNGYLVNYQDTKDLADKLISLMDNEQEMHDFGKVSKLEAEKFSKEKIMKQWEKLFEKLILR